MIEGVLIAVTVGKISTRVDGSVSIVLDTGELTPAKAGEMFGLRNKQAYCYIKAVEVTENEAKNIDGLTPELSSGKTMSQRLRAALFVAWKQNNEGYSDSELYYRYKMEKFVEHVKSKLEPNR